MTDDATPGSIPGEAELLLCCARPGMEGSERVAQVRALLREEMDWEYLVHLALEQKLMPILTWRLQTICPEAVPEATRNRLGALFDSNRRRNLFLTGELYKILELFRLRQIPMIPVKGPALAASVYGNLALRHFNDLDILVRKPDALRARDALVWLGYEPEFRLAGAQAEEYLHCQCELPLSRQDGRVIVEIHWEIVPRYFGFPLAPLDLWGRFDDMAKDDSGLPMLPPEEMLLLLCVHGTKHGWQHLGMICDVASLINVHEEISWQQLMNRAKALGGERMLWLGLFLANDLLGAKLPRDVRQKIEADPTVRSLAAGVRQRLFRENRSLSDRLARRLFFVRARERLRDRIRASVLLATTITPADWPLPPWPDPLLPLYRFWRPLRWAGRWVRALARRLSYGAHLRMNGPVPEESGRERSCWLSTGQGLVIADAPGRGNGRENLIGEHNSSPSEYLPEL